MKAHKKLALAALLKGAGINTAAGIFRAKSYDEIARICAANLPFFAGPGLSLCRRYLRGKTASFGLYIDEPIQADNLPAVTALGYSAGSANYSDYSASRLCLTNMAAAEVKATGHAFLIIDLYDQAAVIIEAADQAHVIIYRHGGKVIARIRRGAAKIEQKADENPAPAGPVGQKPGKMAR